MYYNSGHAVQKYILVEIVKLGSKTLNGLTLLFLTSRFVWYVPSFKS